MSGKKSGSVSTADGDRLGQQSRRLVIVNVAPESAHQGRISSGRGRSGGDELVLMIAVVENRA